MKPIECLTCQKCKSPYLRTGLVVKSGDFKLTIANSSTVCDDCNDKLRGAMLRGRPWGNLYWMSE